MRKIALLVCAVFAASPALAETYGTDGACTHGPWEERSLLLNSDEMELSEYEGWCSLPENAFSGEEIVADCQFGDDGTDTWVSHMTITKQSGRVIIDHLNGVVDELHRCDPIPSS